MKKILYAALMIMLCVSAFGQEEEKQRMNEIKLNPLYIGEEATSEKLDAAFNEACQALALLINQTRKNSITEKQLVNVVERINMKRGDSHRVFVYMKRASIPADTPHAEIVDTVAQASATQATQTQATDTQASPAQSTTQATDQAQDTIQATVTESIPVVVAYQPTTVANTASVTTTANTTPVTTTANTTPTTTNVSTSSASINEVLMSISPREMISEVVKCLELYKEKGKITDFGKATAKNLPSDDHYLIIYARDHTVRAILTPKKDGQRTNIKTNKADEFTNYSGCGLYWFR